MPDRSFEEKFSQMAFLNVEESVPSLMGGEHWVGTQLIDKSEDGRHAMGIMAFLLNQMWLYIPIVYVNGMIKGTNIIYIHNVDLHIPAQDAWISTLKEKGLGFISPLIGSLDESEYNEASDIDITSDEINLKEASARVIEVEDVRKMFRRKPYPGKPFLDKLSELGEGAVMCFARTLTQSPDILNTVLEYHEVGELEKLSSMVAEIEARQMTRPVYEEKLKVYHGMSDKNASELDDKEKRILVRNGSYIKDTRDVTSKVFTMNNPSASLSNPKCDGKYKVLLQDGTYGEYTIWVNAGDNGECLVEYDGKASLIKPTLVLCDKLEDVDAGEPATLKKLATSLGSISNEGAILLVKDKKKYLCTKAEYCGDVLTVNLWGDIEKQLEPVFTGTNGKLSVHGTMLLIPEGTSIVTLSNYQDCPSGIRLGDLQTVTAVLRMSDKYVPLSIENNKKKGIVVKGSDRMDVFQDKVAATLCLARDYGIEAGQARQLVDSSGEDPSDYFVKLAFNIDAIENPISATKVDVLVKDKRQNPQGLQPGQVIEDLTRAASTGLSEVFDTAMYKSLIQGAGVQSFRKEFLLDLIRGMDSTARTMLILYWNYDLFKDKYGEKMGEVESKLQSVFENLGDLILFMKERTETMPDGGGDILGTLALE